MSNNVTACDSSLPSGADISGTLDGFFYGYAVSTVLFGITVVQTWMYINDNNDKWPFRLLVAAMVLGDFATTCLDTQSVHHYVISNFGDLDVITTITTPMAIEYLLTLIIVFCIQIFFAVRVWRIGSFHWTVYASIVLTAVGSLAAGLSAAGQLVMDNSLLGLAAVNSQFEVGWECGLSALSDLITTIALCWSFSHSQTGIKRTDTLLQRFFQYTVTRGVLVTLDQTLFLVFFLTKTERLWWLPFHLCSSKIYVNTMVAMLNSRNSLRTKFDNKNGVITDSDLPGYSSTQTATRTSQLVDSIPDRSIAINKSGSRSTTNKFKIAIPSRKGKDDDTFSDSYIEMENRKPEGIIITREVLPPQVI